MKAIQLNLYPHQTQDGLPYQHLRVQITTDDSIIEPEDLKGLKLPSGILLVFDWGVSAHSFFE